MSLIPLLIQFGVPAIMVLLENILPKAGSGPQRKSILETLLGAIFQTKATAGDMPGIPPAGDISKAIEDLLAMLKSLGVIIDPKAPPMMPIVGMPGAVGSLPTQLTGTFTVELKKSA